MNSRGTLIRYRISGDTLPSSDTVAITPTVHPAAAGTQRYREVDRLRGPNRGPERGPEPDLEPGDASVTDREDMPSIREKLVEALRVAGTNFAVFSRPDRRPRGPGRAAEVLKASSTLLN
ncbi:hypothetical protein MAHJHV58_18380 [Mycobacterium avium subsp. hominissuis]|uniref:Uncharacterized protein n=1 Tax=Mycobacterium avium subsp. hominissuis TaxID=439334 RepID=A0AAI8SNR9_MYCAV|nr:hypothetical protein JPH1_31120 [Mycobacterium avium subsp. hominissuis]